jgi:hypothetical protein
VTYLHSIDPSSGASSALGWSLFRATDSRLVACLLVRGIKAPLEQQCSHYLNAIAAHLNGAQHAQYYLNYRGPVWVEQMEMSMRRDATRCPNETPQQFIGRLIAKANDLLSVQAVGTYLAGNLGTLKLAPPLTWKGTAPKEATKNRVRATLDAGELEIVDQALSKCPGGLAHNLYDAIGIGLHGTGRYRLRGRLG